MTIPEVEQTLTAAIEKRIQEGCRIVYGGFGDHKTCCCAITALPVSPNESRFCDDWDTPTGAILGIQEWYVVAIRDGFDGTNHNLHKEEEREEWWELGQRLRLKFNPERLFF